MGDVNVNIKLKLENELFGAYLTIASFRSASFRYKPTNLAWAPADVSRGCLPPWKCCKLLFYALVTVSYSCSQTFGRCSLCMSYFTFLEGGNGLFSNFRVCFEGNE